MGWWSDVWKKRAENWTFAPLSASQVPDNLKHEPIPSDAAYVEVFLRSARVTHVRKGLTKFYGAAHSSISALHLSQGKVSLDVFTAPDNLRNLDAANVDRAVPINDRLLGPIPYRGGDLEIELGLFSIKSADLAGPYLNLLGEMSALSGSPYLNLALPFAAPLRKGVDLLLGVQQSDETLEIGISYTMNRPETGTFLVMRAPKGTVAVDVLRVGADYRLEGADEGALRDYPYMVFSVEASRARDDWFTVPDVKAPYEDLQDVIRKGKIPEVREAFAAFRRAALTSPDLLFEDAEKIVKKADERVKAVLGATAVSFKETALPDLRELDIYGT